ncbi:p21-activated kinase 3, putative [Trypanosoma cruzi marinkellei]|uniref:p21-activated kinase 3, putative n=1 Tax=Trypanosoma cruzi marinkellei TaxID=85056 RepID=K2NBW3_TRYCR|nr:p21-activated kinase 3, putative [Trypanosoma cruzi marinkellei]
MDIVVCDPRWQHGHVEYKICIRSVTDNDKYLSITYRRFSEIYLVFKRMLELNPYPPLPPLPPKKLFGATDPVFVERRRRELEAFFKAICENKSLVSDIAFLSIVGFSGAKAALDQKYEKDHSTTTENIGCLFAWILSDLPTLDREKYLLATRHFLRSTSYILIRVLPSISFGTPRRFYALIKKGDNEYILSVVAAHPERGLNMKENKNFVSFCGLLLHSPLPFVFRPVEVHTDGVCAYVIRKVVKGGSLRDRAYNANWSTDSEKKFRGKGKAFSNNYIARVVEIALLMVKSFHSSQLSCPFLHFGNCFDVSGKILFSGLEDIFLGITRYPAVLPTTEHTHIDVLLVGVLTLEMALGSPLAHMKEIGFTTAYKDPTEVLEMDIDSRLKLIKGLLEALPSSVPRNLVSFLKATFDPTCKVEIDSLLHHPFITKRHSKKHWMLFGITEEATLPIQLKQKEVLLFCDIANNWRKAVRTASTHFGYDKQSLALVQEMRTKKGNGHQFSESRSYFSDGNIFRRTTNSEEVSVEKGKAIKAPKESSQSTCGLFSLLGGETQPSELPEYLHSKALPPERVSSSI